MKIDFKTLRANSGLTLEKLSRLSGYAIGTISELENKDVGGERLRERLHEILLPQKKSPLERIREAFEERNIGRAMKLIAKMERDMEAVDRIKENLTRLKNLIPQIPSRARKG